MAADTAIREPGRPGCKPVQRPSAGVQAALTAARLASLRNVTQPIEEQQRLQGFVKSYCPIKQFGIIESEGRRIVVKQDEAERCQLTSGAFVTFSLKADDDGSIYASDIFVTLKGAPRGMGRMREFRTKLAGAEINWTKIYVGRIVRLFRETGPLPASFQRRDPGWCFIDCEETHQVFGYDIWAYPSQVAAFRLGDIVSFKIRMDHWWNYPVAYSIAAAPQASTVQNLGCTPREAPAAPQAASRPGCVPEAPRPDPASAAQPRPRPRVGSPFQPGVPVRLSGLKAAPELNGAVGTCCGWDGVKGRWEVRLATGELKSVKAENLSLIPKTAAEAPAAEAPAAEAAAAEAAAAEAAAAEAPAAEAAAAAVAEEEDSKGRAENLTLISEMAGEAEAAAVADDAPPPALTPRGGYVKTAVAKWEQHAGSRSPPADHPAVPVPSVDQGGGQAQPAPVPPDSAGPEGAARAPEPGAGDGEQLGERPGSVWQRYQTEDGSRVWWWCQADGEWFFEDSPGEWVKYVDPNTGRCYWWRPDERWFWASG